MANAPLDDFSLDRMASAVAKVKERLLRAVGALERAGIAYAVAGGHAVAAWVARVDEAAVRNTPDVDLLVRRSALDAIATALAGAGFVRSCANGIDLFLDGPQGKVRDTVHLLFAGEKVCPEHILPAPDVTESEPAGPFPILALDALVKTKLTSFRTKDAVHLRDMLDVGLIDATWLPRLPAELAARLQRLIETPEG